MSNNYLFSSFRNTTFSNVKRFVDIEPTYGLGMEQLSLIDINEYFKRYNGAPSIEKFSSRPDFFIKAEETEEQKLVR